MRVTMLWVMLTIGVVTAGAAIAPSGAAGRTSTGVAIGRTNTVGGPAWLANTGLVNIGLVTTGLVNIGADGLAAAGPADRAAGYYRPPVTGAPRVLRGFSPPATRYGPGHLGVDLAAGPGAPVLAAGAGVVRFAGQVAGRGVVVIAHPDGISTEYEPLVPTVAAGTAVVAGQPIGRLTGRHRGCPAAGCLHWGARRTGRYLDPMSLLRPLGVVRLLPWAWPNG